MQEPVHLQRSLFMPAYVLMGFKANDDLDEVPFKDSPLAASRLAASKPELYESIKEHGVQSPVRVHDRYVDTEGIPTIINGHHRIAAANDINPNMEIPIQYV